MARGEAEFARIERSIWDKARFRSVSDDARLLFLYIVTCRHNNIAGMFILRSGYACDDMGWTAERFDKAFDELLGTGLIKYDLSTRIILDQHQLEKFPPQNPNQTTGMITKLKNLPYTPLFHDLLTVCKRLDKPFMQPLTEWLGELLVNKEEVKEEVKEIIKGQKSTPSASKKEKTAKKEGFIFLLPNWIPVETWGQFEAMRKKIKKPLTPYASHLIVKEIEKIRASTGQGPVAILNESIKNSWQGVFPVKENNNGARSTGRQFGFNRNPGPEIEQDILDTSERLRRKYESPGNAPEGEA